MSAIDAAALHPERPSVGAYLAGAAILIGGAALVLTPVSLLIGGVGTLAHTLILGSLAVAHVPVFDNFFIAGLASLVAGPTLLGLGELIEKFTGKKAHLPFNLGERDPFSKKSSNDIAQTRRNDNQPSSPAADLVSRSNLSAESGHTHVNETVDHQNVSHQSGPNPGSTDSAPDLVSETRGDQKTPRHKAALHHKRVPIGAHIAGAAIFVGSLLNILAPIALIATFISMFTFPIWMDAPPYAVLLCAATMISFPGGPILRGLGNLYEMITGKKPRIPFNMRQFGSSLPAILQVVASVVSSAVSAETMINPGVSEFMIGSDVPSKFRRMKAAELADRQKASAQRDPNAQTADPMTNQGQEEVRNKEASFPSPSPDPIKQTAAQFPANIGHVHHPRYNDVLPQPNTATDHSFPSVETRPTDVGETPIPHHPDGHHLHGGPSLAE